MAEINDEKQNAGIAETENGRKVWLLRGLFLLLFLVVYYYTDILLSDKNAHGFLQAREMYAQPRNSIDVVFMGSSHIHCDVNTALLWTKYGIASYDYSAAEQPLWVTYYYLKEVCRYQNPSLIVLDLYSPARFKGDYQYYFLRQNITGMRFSLNKLQALYVSCKPAHFLDFFPSIATYHDRYDNLRKSDWIYVFKSREDRAVFKGYTPYYIVDPQEEPSLEQDRSGGITVKSEIYLQRIIDYTKENGIDLFLIVSPYITTDEDELVYNRIHEIAEHNELEFNSTNYYYQEMDLNFQTDFNDNSHLNYLGSCKFTDYLGAEIKAKFDIPDRRGDPRYVSWDRHAEDIDRQVAETAAKQQKILEEMAAQESGSGE